MKKLIALLCLLFLLAGLITPAYAETAPVEDTFHIPEEILSMLPLKYGDKVICVYSEILYYAFYKYDSIDALLDPDTGADAIRCYCIESADGTYATYRIHNGELHSMDRVWWDWEETNHDVAIKRLKHIDPNITIYNTYFISGERTEGHVVYYKTNLGDFVYYDSTEDAAEYLFSIEAFCAFQSAVYRNERVNNLPEPLIGGINNNLWDLSAYDISYEDFDPYAKFPLKNKSFFYGRQFQQFVTIGIFILLLGTAIMLTLLHLGKRYPAVLKAKKQQYVAVCLLLFIAVLILDYTFADSLLTRDFTSRFLTVGMGKDIVTALVGTQHRDVGNKFPALEYRLLHDFYFYLCCDEAGVVTEIWEYERTYPLRSWLLPLLFAVIALCASSIYLITHRWGRKLNRPELRLWMGLSWTVIGLILFDQFVVRSIFPECYVYEGMRYGQLRAVMGPFSHFVPGTNTIEFELTFGRTLVVELEDFIWNAPVLDCQIIGLGDPSYLRFILPVTIAAAAVGFGVRCLRLRSKHKEVSV